MRHGHSADHGGPSRYRIEAMAHTAADVVRNLGGLLFDRRCLGWDTAVQLNDCVDIRPLQIIGAECADLESALDKHDHPRPTAIATSVQLYCSDPRICAQVDAAIDSGSTEVVLWGDTNKVGVNPNMIAVAHQISRAAATFKIQALAAAAHAESTTDIAVETFLATRATWQPPDLQQTSYTSRSGTTVRF